MAASSSSGSSFTSSSLGRPPAHGQPSASPLDATWTPTSGASTISALTSEASAPHASLHPLDLGPPGYQATMYDLPARHSCLSLDTHSAGTVSPVIAKAVDASLSDTPYIPELSLKTHQTNEPSTLAHGKWLALSSAASSGSAATGSDHNPVPSDIPADIFPHTLHVRHRPYTDPCELELFVSFREPHRVRYTTGEGVVIHDHLTEVKYEFTTVEGSIRFQGDSGGGAQLRQRVQWYTIFTTSY
ncbi:hypothetical protein CSUB01_08764 [Colletotrichum sublineola]|uniref:Uncharacterized protein n=1 Tax=Colletotrichum sublineola TaxID=1173701 RepID=A0A066XTS2_COLSU|nr:hypothetical protein CSUB01_08764 [Colletotrichum sublineola]